MEQFRLPCPRSVLAAKANQGEQGEPKKFGDQQISKSTKATAREVIIPAKPRKQKRGAENHGGSNSERNDPPHGMQAGCD